MLTSLSSVSVISFAVAETEASVNDPIVSLGNYLLFRVFRLLKSGTENYYDNDNLGTCFARRQ